MGANEMFEKLGYKRSVEREKIIYLFETEDRYYYQVTFDLSEKIVDIETNFERTEIENDLLQAIDKQAEELGWLDEKICTNFEDGTGGFWCSNCGIYLDDLNEIVIPENCKGNVNQDGYDLRYCPNCGCKIVDYENFAKKAKYKVTQFEFDLLNTYRLCKEECKFRDCTQLRQLKEKGYYKDVDANAKIRDILWNCGVIKDENC